MRRCAFLTLAERGDFVIDDEHAYAPLARLGWRVDAVPWNSTAARWNDYELVVIRSTWDYQAAPDAFLAVLARIEDSTARLANPLEVVRWNLRKTYLRDLEKREVPVVPTTWHDRLERGGTEMILDALETDEAVIKPQVGANADGAFRFARHAPASAAEVIERYYADTPLLAQPFLPSIQTEGEFSLFYFNGNYSHAVLKTPGNGDFRCQEEHGALVIATEIDSQLREAGRRAIDAIGTSLLYARADFVRHNKADDYRLMELELIEPSLYLRMHEKAPARFAQAIDEMMRRAK